MSGELGNWGIGKKLFPTSLPPYLPTSLHPTPYTLHPTTLLPYTLKPNKLFAVVL
jgi:hypothetical protein